MTVSAASARGRTRGGAIKALTCLATSFLLGYVGPGAASQASAVTLATSADTTFRLSRNELAGMAPCSPGAGTDYLVGPGPGQLSSLDLVPWESLKAGDTVRITYQSTPYRSKFLIAGKGTATMPIRVCGIRGPNGERPIIEGANATTRAQLNYSNDNGPNGLLHQTRSIIVVKPLGDAPWRYFPEHIQIDGLQIRGAHPSNTFADNRGVVRRYVAFGACVWLERGHNITLRDNELHNCTNGVFSKSTDDAYLENDPSQFSVTKDIRLIGNVFHGNGIVGDNHQHNTYIQSVNATYESNHYGALRLGAMGSALKDRSAGTVIRYNRIEEGARSVDLVEAEDFPRTALSLPSYRSTFVYGNQIVKDGTTGIAVHYGADHTGAPPGAWWGEPISRKGTLYFFNNTMELRGGGWAIYAFQFTTTEEHAQIWNNVLTYSGNVSTPALRTGQEVGRDYVTGGTTHLGKNWINQGWKVNDPEHPVPGPVYGTENMISSELFPINMRTMLPLAGGMAVDAGEATPPGAEAHPVLFQLNTQLKLKRRIVNGEAIDLGARER